MAVAPNRLLPGIPMSALGALGPVVYPAAALVLAAAIVPARRHHLVALALILTALGLVLASTGLAAKSLLEGRPPAARAMLGADFWIGCGALLALAFERARQSNSMWAWPVTALALCTMIGAGAAFHLFDGVSLMVEYRARSAALHSAIGQHLLLSAGALALSLAIAAPLGWAAWRSRRVEATANAVLAAVQVTPAIALFGLLIPVLAALLSFAPALRQLGLGAIGPAPALIGVAVYLALPLLRGFVSGLKATDPAVVEAAQAMGMTQLRTTCEIRIPLGLPILMSALRVAAVQSIGLVTLGGLIGAGGLGAIVFEGMSQFAADLIILGAIPIVILALVVDGGLAWVFRSPVGSTR
jgi:osmoprotectant transport system permease protein